LKLLLDSHTLLWWLNQDPSLSRNAKAAISKADNEIFVSSASAWEIAIKVRLGRLPTGKQLVQNFWGHITREQFQPLAISIEHAVQAGLPPGLHKDPFDRMLIAQAQLENAAIVSNDKIFDSYGVARIW
jgi:PIN domain nuclease of toxin-antitoxin system